jgi:hypothetical protein
MRMDHDTKSQTIVIGGVCFQAEVAGNTHADEIQINVAPSGELREPLARQKDHNTLDWQRFSEKHPALAALDTEMLQHEFAQAVCRLIAGEFHGTERYAVQLDHHKSSQFAARFAAEPHALDNIRGTQIIDTVRSDDRDADAAELLNIVRNKLVMLARFPDAVWSEVDHRLLTMERKNPGRHAQAPVSGVQPDELFGIIADAVTQSGLPDTERPQITASIMRQLRPRLCPATTQESRRGRS